MATNASYIPIFGNFNPANGFRLINSVGDALPQAPLPDFGPGRPGRFKFGLTLLALAGPVADDATFKLRMPYPHTLKPEVLAVNINAYFPTLAITPQLPGSTAQDVYAAGQPVFDLLLNTIEVELAFGAPAPTPWAATLYVNFGYSVTD